MDSHAQDVADLERALLYRGLRVLASAREHCGRCGRSLLVGERFFLYSSGGSRCELCSRREERMPAEARVVHGPAFGHTLRVLDRRAA